MLRLPGCTTAAAALQLGCLLHDRPAQANRDSGLTTAVETVASRTRLCSDLWRQRLQDSKPRQRQQLQGGSGFKTRSRGSASGFKAAAASRLSAVARASGD